MSFKEKLPEFEPADRAALRAWLEDNYDKSTGVWLLLHKKGSAHAVITYSEMVDELLCFGWIDSVRNSLDAGRYKQMITPRKKATGWSKVNKAKVERLQAAGLLHAAGVAMIEAAKADGSWTALDELEDGTMPRDLQIALKADKAAWTAWQTFPFGSQKIILRYIASAKKEETRKARIEETVRLAAQGKRANHWRQ